MYFKQNGKNVKCNLNEGRGALGIATYLNSNPRYPRILAKSCFVNLCNALRQFWQSGFILMFILKIFKPI